ncbi:MAG: hypothetical protein ACTHVE_00180 [Senegalia sp. (in: firmicutes)]|uniref:hypothetical protein n=1 Tax=Senegalia sp. (in: firmicutes) TaxID=1924098 RepID=UPI003F9821E6
MPFKDINLDYNIMAENNIPLLVNNAEWKKIFGNSDDKYIQIAKKELLEKLKHERETKSKLKDLQSKKRKEMVNIVNLSHMVNNDDKKAIKKLENSRDKIIKINEETEDLKFELDMIPSQIRKANFELLNITVTIAYEDLKLKEKKLFPINDEISDLRIKLKKLIEDKNDYEESINDTYTFLHNIIGKKEIEKLDKNFFE